MSKEENKLAYERIQENHEFRNEGARYIGRTRGTWIYGDFDNDLLERPMMNFSDFVESANAAFKKALKESPRADQNWPVPPLEESRVFYLGEDSDFTDAINDIKPDLHKEMKDGIPMPFKDISVVTIVRKAFGADLEKEFVRGVFGQDFKDGRPRLIPEGAPVWVLDRLIEVGEEDPTVKNIIKISYPEAIAEVKQWFQMSRYHGYEGLKAAPMGFAVGYCGVRENGFVRTLTLEAVRPMGQNIVSNLEQVAAISHPANYVVKVTPELTPREARKVSAGAPRPPQKRTHFIVVDHEVLVGMRRGDGTHASPVPHERRGHWMRLAERCRHAKLLGKDKVWVRPAFVGEKEWKNPKNHYEVLLDFNEKKVEV